MIIFENKGEIDVRAITTFGINVKETESPIGYFGTGLKYATAVLLRLDESITIQSGMRRLQFKRMNQRVRGKDFDFIGMSEDGENWRELGFTTELGKNWQPWMVYRELMCNCKDEGGSVQWIDAEPPRLPGVTRIIVDGPSMDGAHMQREKFLLEGSPDHTLPGLEIFDRPGQAVFYRGVKVMDLMKPSRYTYNITRACKLTEDRTMDMFTMTTGIVGPVMSACEDRGLMHRMLTCGPDHFEGSIDWDWTLLPVSPAFLDAVENAANAGVANIPVSALRVLERLRKERFKPVAMNMTAVQKETLDRAVAFCRSIGFNVDQYPILVAESLGNGCLGLAYQEQIFIAERTFQLGGTKQVASTLIEEYIHLRHGWKDMSRELQSFLFDKVVSLGEELQGRPL